MKTFVIGDIHGSYRALRQCFERARFDYARHRLIVLGDVVDGYPEVGECMDELLKIAHCDMIIGNHDLWALDWALYDEAPLEWTSQGGAATLRSYGDEGMPQAHIDFLKNAHLYLEENGCVFVHAGFDPQKPLSEQSKDVLTWDRSLLNTAWKKYAVCQEEPLGVYKEIFIGHTTTETFESTKPLHCCNLWELDTGAGWSGCLTMMNLHTKKYVQSDLSSKLYGGLPNQL